MTNSRPGKVQKPGPKVHEKNYLSSINIAKANQYPRSPWQICTNLRALRGIKCILQTGSTSVCLCDVCILRSEKLVIILSESFAFVYSNVGCMPCPCLTPFALITHFRFVWLLPWFGYVWILRCKPRGMRHFLPCTCMAFGLNSAKASSSVSLTDLVDAQRCGTRALLHQVGHETSLLQSLQNESE